MTDRVRKLLVLEPSAEHRLSIATFGSHRKDPRVCPVVNVGLMTRGDSHMYLSLFAVPMICEPIAAQPISACIEKNRHLAGLDLADFADTSSSLEVDILIGSDYYWSIVTGETCRGDVGPIAIHTRLGWVLSGPTSLSGLEQGSVNLVTTHVLRADTVAPNSEPLNDTLKSFWELESLGIQGPEKTVHDEFVERVTFKDGRYQVSLPWKEFHKPLPSNYQLSLNRLWGLLRRLKQNPLILQEYDRIIKEQLKTGIIEPAPERVSASSRPHYLPHHAIVRTDKSTTKLRVVYDASAQCDGPSLNECLHTGPKFNQHILDILLRFRHHRVALTADIEKAFLMISVAEPDRDSLRFLWVDDIAKDKPDVCALRFSRVVFGVSSSPFLLNATIKYHLQQSQDTHPELVPKLIQSTYVDDIVTGATSEDECFHLYKTAKELFLNGGFNLRKFLTNSCRLQQRIDDAEKRRSGRASPSELEDSYVKATLGNMQQTQPEESKILGVRWNPLVDQLIFDTVEIARLAGALKPTKRNIISTIGKFYDPLGFLSPVIIRFKVLFQKLCELKVGWDETPPDELLQEWRSLVSDLKEGHPVSIPRSYHTSTEENQVTYSLCGFCDASTRAYAAVVYLLLRSETNTTVQFLAAKTRVAPLQSQTIPRLELLSALLLSRLIVSVSSSLNSMLPQLESRCYTDSRVALFWIRGTEKEWKPFVRNRVAEIRRNVPPECWSHCAGNINPADKPSRGITLQQLSSDKLWRGGPDWLLTISSIKDEPDPNVVPEECLTEMKSKDAKSVHTLVANEQGPMLREVIDCKKYGTMSRLLRVTAYVIRAVEAFKNIRQVTLRSNSALTPEELANAEKLWIADSQQDLVQERKFPTWKNQFNLFLDDKGLWRCGGRLENANLPYSTKHPILLPRAHHITSLIVWDAHRRVQHNGVKETLTEIRARYWIVKGRSLVKSTIRHCVLCKRFEGTPYHGPVPPPLPTFRVQEEPPFSYTGVDFAGPLHVRTTGSSEANKAWICLFTCCVVRAVHLEIVSDMSTETFIRCLKRFVARRGMPRKFVSDNGKTFKAGAMFLKSVFQDEEVVDHLAGVGVEWVFNIERAPWWGGVFERMVRSTKRCLKKMIGQAKLSLDELHTMIVEIESIINSRPLSYVSSSDLEEPLTPSHLLLGRRILNLPDNLGYLPDSADEEFTVDSSHLRRRVRHLSNTLNHFWRRWRDEYLVELREAHRQSNHNRLPHSSIASGDVVVVHDENLPRGFWRLGRIEEVISGRDGRVRGATVRLASRNRQKTLLHRPIQLLYPLEIHDAHSDSSARPTGESQNSSQILTDTEPQQEEGARRRSKRISANSSDDRRRALLLQSEET